MTRSRTKTLLSLLKGLAGAILLTLLLMAMVAALAAMGRISDDLLMALNQLMKLAAILLGVTLAVGRGGRRGFVTGMALAMLYMALGYGCYAALGGSAFSTSEFLGEVMLGAAVGAVAGAVLSNLPAKQRAA